MLSGNCGCSFTIHYEAIEIKSLHIPNDLASKYILKFFERIRESDSSRIVVGDSNIFLPETNRLSRQKKTSKSVRDVYNVI